MIAVPGVGDTGPMERRRAGVTLVRPARSRLVAVAVSPLELLRPGSDLARIVGGSGRVDLLVARDELDLDADCADVTALAGEGAPCEQIVIDIAALAGDPDPLGVEAFDAAVEYDEDDDDLYDEDDEDFVLAAVAELGLPDLHLHRLGLSGRVSAAVEADLTAALSELVGFDPEPGVYLVAPTSSPSDPERTTIVEIVNRLARVYGIPMLRYRSLELSVVPHEHPGTAASA
ncbi:MAG: hypothetical protein OJJ54_07275 [Pseudonocardia sp.]|nr:hypothetical protein [Pseudonocardia sp.]